MWTSFLYGFSVMKARWETSVNQWTICYIQAQCRALCNCGLKRNGRANFQLENSGVTTIHRGTYNLGIGILRFRAIIVTAVMESAFTSVTLIFVGGGIQGLPLQHDKFPRHRLRFGRCQRHPGVWSKRVLLTCKNMYKLLSSIRKPEHPSNVPHLWLALQLA